MDTNAIQLLNQLDQSDSDAVRALLETEVVFVGGGEASLNVA
mgnify:CR=1 FL=1